MTALLSLMLHHCALPDVYAATASRTSEVGLTPRLRPTSATAFAWSFTPLLSLVAWAKMLNHSAPESCVRPLFCASSSHYALWCDVSKLMAVIGIRIPLVHLIYPSQQAHTPIPLVWLIVTTDPSGLANRLIPIDANVINLIVRMHTTSPMTPLSIRDLTRLLANPAAAVPTSNYLRDRTQHPSPDASSRGWPFKNALDAFPYKAAGRQSMSRSQGSGWKDGH